MKDVKIKSGVCVFNGALVRVLEYGKVQQADLFKVGDTIIVRFYDSIHAGGWQDRTRFTHTLLLALHGYLQETSYSVEVETGIGMMHEDRVSHLAVVPMAQFEGQLRLPDGTFLDLVLEA